MSMCLPTMLSSSVKGNRDAATYHFEIMQSNKMLHQQMNNQPVVTRQKWDCIHPEPEKEKEGQKKNNTKGKSSLNSGSQRIKDEKKKGGKQQTSMKDFLSPTLNRGIVQEAEQPERSSELGE